MDVVLLILKVLGGVLIVLGFAFLITAGMLATWINRDPPEDWQ